MEYLCNLGMMEKMVLLEMMNKDKEEENEKFKIIAGSR